MFPLRGIEQTRSSGIKHMMESFIRLENISKTYGQTIVLDIESETIPLNAVVAIVGYSGSGKSTLLNLISLLDVPDTMHCRTRKKPRLVFYLQQTRIEVTYQQPGWLRFASANARRFVVAITQADGSVHKSPVEEVRATYFGYVFQDAHLHPNFNLLDNVKTPLIIRNKSLHPKGLEALLRASGLHEHADKYVTEMSGGEQQRTAIVRSIIKNSPILIGDEPTSNIDRDRGEQLLRLFEHSVKQERKSFLWVTHDIHLAGRFAEKIVTIRDRTIRVHDKPDSEAAILHLLHRETDEKLEEITAPGDQERDVTRSEILHHYAMYALRDLFHKIRHPLTEKFPFNFFLHKPGADFFVSFLSIFLVLLFLLSLSKIGYATRQYMEAKLSDPRINNLKITPPYQADNTLTISDIDKIQDAVNKQDLSLRDRPAAVYKTTLAIVRERDQRRFPLSKAAITFEKGDKIINGIVEDKYGFVNDSEHYDGIILYRDTLERMLNRLELSEIPETFSISIDRLVRKMPVLVTDSPLPDNRHAMLRSDLYLEAYHEYILERDPEIAYILVYPKNIHDTVPIMHTLMNPPTLSDRKYQVGSALDIHKKIEVITEIETLVGGIVAWSLGAIAVLAVSFVALTIYRSMHRKRKEIGVFMAFGMKKRAFVFFYLIEAFILWSITTAATHMTFRYLISPEINAIITAGEHLGNMDDIEVKTIINPAVLDMPSNLLLWHYAGSFVLLAVVFIVLILYTVRNLPVRLINDA